MFRYKKVILFLFSSQFLCGACQLAEVHDGQYCNDNTSGQFSEDPFSAPQTDTTISDSITSTRICPLGYPYCIETVCSKCGENEVSVSPNDSKSFVCMSCDEVENCDSESCAAGLRRCQGLPEEECTPGCHNGILTECIDGKPNKKSCLNGCNEKKTGCLETDASCRSGELLVKGKCVCDEDNHWVKSDDHCVCDSDSHWIRNENDCVCNSNEYRIEENGTCVCDTSAYRIESSGQCICDPELHRVDKDGTCVCDQSKGFYEKDGECISAPCNPISEIEIEGGGCICNQEAHWTGDAGACSCDKANSFYEIDDACVELLCDPVSQIDNGDGTCSCNTQNHWVQGDGECICDAKSHYIFKNDKCVQQTCDPYSEEYGPDGLCTCKTSEHWVLDEKSGKCVCNADEQYYLINNTCQQFICETPKETYSTDEQKCICNKEKHWILQDDKCVCDAANLYIEKDGACIQDNCKPNQIIGDNGKCVCNQKLHWVEINGDCKCDENANYYLMGSDCVLQCGEHQILQGDKCVCDTANGYQQSGSICTKITCSTGEILVGSSCQCDTANHWTGTAGNCTCASGYVNNNGICQIPNCGINQTWNSSLNRCTCNTGDGWADTGNGNCSCSASGWVYLNDCTPLSRISLGSTIQFGSYQSQAIQWRVIGKTDRDLTLLSEYILDVKQFSSSSAEWAYSSLHNWLNSTFINSAFSQSELEQIKYTSVPAVQSVSAGIWTSATLDRVFLLSYEDAQNLWGGGIYDKVSGRIAPMTSYAQNLKLMAAGGIDGQYGWWWLRNPGESYGAAMHITAAGQIFQGTGGNGDVTHYGGVRPVIVIGH